MWHDSTDSTDGTAKIMGSEQRKQRDLGRLKPACRLVLALLGLTAVVVAFFSSYSSALGAPTPHHVPVAVTAPPVVLSRLGTSPLLRVYPVPSLAAARAMVEDRAVDGALVLPRSGTATLLVANGGGHAVDAFLAQWGQQEASAHTMTLRTLDLAPTSPQDPNGAVEFYCLIFLGIGGAVGASLLSRTLGLVRGLPDALKRLGGVLLYAAVLSAVVTLFTDFVYGALVGHVGFLFLVLWLFVAAVGLAVTGVAALAGMLPSAVLIIVFVLFGNTSSGGAVPRPLLNGFYAALNPVLPHGAALWALRGVQYFGDRGMGQSLLCLAIWAAAGFLLLVAAGLRATRGGRAPASPGLSIARSGVPAAGPA